MSAPARADEPATRGEQPAGPHPLDNAIWHALTTTQEGFAETQGGARRYRPDVSIFHAVDRFDHHAWADLAELAGPGHALALFRDAVPVPPDGWERVIGGPGYQMVAAELAPPTAVGAVRPLTDDDLPEILALVELTKPGPFAARTIDLGGYVGLFDEERLMAMAGERMRLPGYGEVSAVCTHPDARGRGLGSVVTRHVSAAIQERGETAFLHVATTNEGARRVYERLGFATRRTVELAVLRTPGART